MDMRIILKALLIFWGIVLVVILLKVLTNVKVEDFDFDFLKKEFQLNNKDNAIIYFPLEEQNGFVINGVESCSKDYKSTLYVKGYSFDTSGSCYNESCKIQIAFKEKIPQTVKLYIKANNDCNLKEVNVPKVLDVIGYSINLQLSESQKSDLGILIGDKIRLEHASGYTLSAHTQLYFYNTQVDKDNILVNDTIVGQVFFNKNTIHTQTVPVSKDEEEINIPHPKELYTFTCNSSFQCKKEANTYIVNLDGVDFIPSKEFILTCLSNKQLNKFCTFFVKIGDTLSMQFNSKSMMNSYINTSKNPEFNDSFKTWEQKRLETAKEKIKNSLL